VIRLIECERKTRLAFRHGGLHLPPIVRALASLGLRRRRLSWEGGAHEVIGIAVFAVCFLAIVYAAFDLRRDHNQINRIREECRQKHSDAGK